METVSTLPPIISLVGTSCAGKTTLAREIAARVPKMVHVEVDALIETEPKNEFVAMRANVLDIYKDKILPILKNGDTVIIDHINITNCSYAHVVPVLVHTQPATLLRNFRRRTYESKKTGARNLGFGVVLYPLLQYVSFYTSDRHYTKNKRPLARFEVSDLRGIFDEFLYLFSADYEVDNKVAEFVTHLNAKHTARVLDIYPRGPYCDMLLIPDTTVKERIEIFKKTVLPILNDRDRT